MFGKNIVPSVISIPKEAIFYLNLYSSERQSNFCAYYFICQTGRAEMGEGGNMANPPLILAKYKQKDNI